MNEWGNYCLPTLLLDFIINWTIHMRTNNSMSFLPISVLGGEWDLVFKTMKNYKATYILYVLEELSYCTCTSQKKKKKKKTLVGVIINSF